MGHSGAVDTEAVRDVFDRMTRRREELARSMTERIIGEVEEYSESSAADLFEGVEANCRDHFDSLLHYSRTGELPPLTRGSTLSKPVTDRIRQGIRLDAYLHAFRVGQSVFWEAILAEAGDDAGTALEFAGPSMAYVDEICTRMAGLYLQASQRLKSEEERADRDLLDSLLAGTSLDAKQESRVTTLGIEGRLLVAVLRTASGAPDPDEVPLRSLVERALSRANADGLVVPRHGSLVAVIGLDRGSASAIVAALKSVAGSQPVQCGISAEAVGLGELGQASEQAHAVLAHTREDQPVVALSEAGAYEYLLYTSGPLLRRMVDQNLLAAVEASAVDETGLIETARVYLESDLSARIASERLFVHDNTLRYRLRQLESRAGISLGHFPDLVELRIALDLQEMVSEAARNPA